MKYSWILLLILSAGGITSRAQAPSNCFPGLVVQAIPMIARANDRVNLRIVISDRPPGSPFTTFQATLAYPAGVTPLVMDVKSVPFPEGVFRNTIGGAGYNPVTRQVDISEVGGPTQSNSVKFRGPVLDLPLQTSGLQPPEQFDLTTSDALIQNASGQCWISLPSTTTLQVTGPGGPGDVDGDGQVTAKDALLALRIVLGLVMPGQAVLKSADVWPPGVGDGRVSLEDVGKIRRSFGEG